MHTDLFLTQAWFDLLREHGLAHSPHAVQTLELPGTVLGETPARLWLQQSQPRGAWASLANYYTGIFGPVGGHGMGTSEQWEVCLRAFKAQPGSGVLVLEPLGAASPWVEALEAGARRAGYLTWREPAFGNWYQPVEPGRFDAYWSQRPSSLRHTVERARRRLDRAGPWQVEIHSAAAGHDSATLARLCAAYLQVYALSWKPQEANPAFMQAFMDWTHRHGCLRLGVLTREGEAIAAQLWLVYPGQSAQIFKLAHVLGQEKWSAGSVLTAELARHAIDVDGVAELDFLSGDDAYKANWMGLRRERVRLVLAHPGSRLGLGLLVRHAFRRLLDK